MDFIAILHAKARYVHQMLSDGSSAFTHMCDVYHMMYEKQLCTSGTIVMIEGAPDVTLPSEFRVIVIKDTMRALLDALHSLKSDTGCITWADNMFQSISLYERLCESHTKYLSHYTHCEGYPEGVSPECISFEGIQMMHAIAHSDDTCKDMPITRKGLFSVLEKKINEFDIEAELAPVDMRWYRIELYCNTRRNFHIAKKLWEAGLRNPDDIPIFFDTHPEKFMGHPAYVYLQVTDIVPKCMYAPFPVKSENEGVYIDKEIYTILIDKIHEYVHEAVLCIGFAGEPAAHPSIHFLLEYATSKFNMVYLETNGRDWDITASWWNEPWVKDITWIVSIDAFSETIYQKIHHNPIEHVLRFVNFLQEKLPPERLYVQATRMQDNEEELGQFFTVWKEREVLVIIQKYNDYSGILADRKVIDLAPVHRIPCRHVARDLVVCLNGEVAMCSQDISHDDTLGNILKDSLEIIMHKKEQQFIEQVNKQYKSICRSCDEYYTVNA